ncbi:MAG: hypothetical protein PHX80_04220 [Candidatus Nanoarchaeia archaeon]|nr:hypothetical protein [Candidatus Nanoarchaeia archaeon]
MSDYDIGSKITADISQYLEALNQVEKKTEGSWAEINQSIKNIDNQYKVWGDSVDSVAEKQRVLQGTINTLISQGMDPNDEKIQKLKASYDELGASVPQAIVPIKTGLESWGISLDTMYNKGAAVFKQFGIDLDQLALKLKTTGPMLAGWATVAVVLGGIGNKIVEYTQQIADAGDAFVVMSAKTGIGIGQLQTLKYAVEQTEGSFSAVTAAVSFMTRTLDTNAKKFEQLGIEVKNADGSMRNAGDIFNETLLRLSDMEDKTARNALAFDLFGRGVTDLIPTLNAGSKEIKGLQDRAEQLGLVISDKLAEAGNEFNDNMETLKQTANGLGYTLAQVTIPAFNSMVTALTSVIEWYRTGIQTILDWKKVQDVSDVIANWKKGKASVIDYYDALTDAIAINERSLESDKLSVAERTRITNATHNYRLALSSLTFQHGAEIEAHKKAIGLIKDTSGATTELTEDQKTYKEINEQLVKTLSQIAEKEKLYGDAFDEQGERKKAVQDSVNQLIEKGFTVEGNGIKSLLSQYGGYFDFIATDGKKAYEEAILTAEQIALAEGTVTDAAVEAAKIIVDTSNNTTKIIKSNGEDYTTFYKLETEETLGLQRASDAELEAAIKLRADKEKAACTVRIADSELTAEQIALAEGTVTDAAVEAAKIITDESNKTVKNVSLGAEEIKNIMGTTFSGVETIIKDLTYDMDDMSKAGVDAGINIGKSFLNVITSGGSIVAVIGLVITVIDELIKVTNKKKEAEKAAFEQQLKNETTLYEMLSGYQYDQMSASEKILQDKQDAIEKAIALGATEKQLGEIREYWDKKYIESLGDIKSATDSLTESINAQAEAERIAAEWRSEAAQIAFGRQQNAIQSFGAMYEDLLYGSMTTLEKIEYEKEKALAKAFEKMNEMRAFGVESETSYASMVRLINEKYAKERQEELERQANEQKDSSDKRLEQEQETANEIEEYNKKWQDTQKTKLELIEEEREAELKKANDIGASQETLLAIQSYYATEYKKEVDSIAKAEQKVIDDQAQAAQKAADIIQKAADAAAKASYDYARSVIDVGQEIINGINEGLNEADFTTAIMKKLQQAAIEAAILSAGLGEAMALIGKEIADAMIGGLTGEEISKIKSDIASLYNQAQGIAGQIGQLFPQAAAAVGQIENIEQSLYPTGLVFNTPGGMNSGFTSGGQKGSNYFTFYSPTAIDAAEAARLMNKTTRDMAFQGVIS